MLSLAEGTDARVIHASSFSKTVSPGVRVGYLVGPEDEIKALAKGAGETYISPNMLAESIVFELCISGALDENIVGVNAALAEQRRDAVVRELGDQIPEAKFVVPACGRRRVDLRAGSRVRARLPRRALRDRPDRGTRACRVRTPRRAARRAAFDGDQPWCAASRGDRLLGASAGALLAPIRWTRGAETTSRVVESPPCGLREPSTTNAGHRKARHLPGASGRVTRNRGIAPLLGDRSGEPGVPGRRVTRERGIGPFAGDRSRPSPTAGAGAMGSEGSIGDPGEAGHLGELPASPRCRSCEAGRGNHLQRGPCAPRPQRERSTTDAGRASCRGAKAHIWEITPRLQFLSKC